MHPDNALNDAISLVAAMKTAISAVMIEPSDEVLRITVERDPETTLAALAEVKRVCVEIAELGKLLQRGSERVQRILEADRVGLVN